VCGGARRYWRWGKAEEAGGKKDKLHIFDSKDTLAKVTDPPPFPHPEGYLLVHGRVRTPTEPSMKSALVGSIGYGGCSADGLCALFAFCSG
jgi:hypothetical protein